MSQQVWMKRKKKIWRNVIFLMKLFRNANEAWASRGLQFAHDCTRPVVLNVFLFMPPPPFDWCFFLCPSPPSFFLTKTHFTISGTNKLIFLHIYFKTDCFKNQTSYMKETYSGKKKEKVLHINTHKIFLKIC